MLILTRRTGESLTIGHGVTVTVLGVKGDQVRVGIKALAEVTIHREEGYERVAPEQSQGVTSAAHAHRSADASA